MKAGRNIVHYLTGQLSNQGRLFSKRYSNLRAVHFFLDFLFVLSSFSRLLAREKLCMWLLREATQFFHTVFPHSFSTQFFSGLNCEKKESEFFEA